jgi:SOS-response transcriptional repressor LexA
MNDEKPNYYAVIPATVRYDKELKPNEKLLYGEISALAQKEGYCWASNTYFAELYDTSPISISRYINHLKEKGYIDVKLVYRNNTKEIEKRLMGINRIDNRYYQNCIEGINKIVNRGINRIVKDNNTSINNININKREREERKTDRPTLSDIEVYVKENNLSVNPKSFFDYFEAGSWIDSKGNEVTNWKQKLLTWERYEPKERTKEDDEDKKEKDKWDRFLRGEI